VIDRDSEPGSYADALRYPHSIRVSEYLSRAADPLPAAADDCGTAVLNPDAVPPFSDDPFHIERYTS
jgi:hypothetical protein